jgi:hypothetical protein
MPREGLSRKHGKTGRNRNLTCNRLLLGLCLSRLKIGMRATKFLPAIQSYL